MESNKPIRIAMVAGEVSGDLLGADLIRALKQRCDNIEVYGIGGPEMIAQGFHSVFDMERLSVMGLVEVVGRLWELLGIRRKLFNQFRADPPDVFVGIDAPDFNTDLELKLKAVGIRTVHYVSPTIWAWRSSRINKIRRAVDHMLVIFPFEMKYYEQNNMRATFVGHPAANETPERIDRLAVRRSLGLPEQGQLLAVLPGSRNSELSRHADLFVQTLARVHEQFPDVMFAVPFVKPGFKQRFMSVLKKSGIENLPIHEFDGRSREVLSAADVALLASGTAALESAVTRTPMVVTYRMNALSMWLIRHFAHVKLYSMPNNLAGYELVPEYIQEQATADNLSSELCALLADDDRRAAISTELEKIYQQLRCNTGKIASKAILEEVERARSRSA